MGHVSVHVIEGALSKILCRTPCNCGRPPLFAFRQCTGVCKPISSACLCGSILNPGKCHCWATRRYNRKPAKLHFPDSDAHSRRYSKSFKPLSATGKARAIKKRIAKLL